MCIWHVDQISVIDFLLRFIVYKRIKDDFFLSDEIDL